MRAFCTVSAPLEVCASSAEQLSPGSRFLALRLLGNQQPKTLYFLVDAKSRVREVYTQTCLHFAAQGMLDTELFGLAVLIDGEYMFADPESKLSKYGPKSWRSSHTHGLDANGRPLLELHFRVQFYIESPFLLKDEISRHNYYLQLKYNALQREMPKEYSEQSMILLAGLALQADLGDAPAATQTIAATSKGTTLKSLVSEEGGCGGLVECDHLGLLSSHVTSSTASTNEVTNLAAKAIETTTTTTTKETTAAAAAGIATTTLPKSNKRISNENDRVLRLSNFLTARNSTASTLNTSPLVANKKIKESWEREKEREREALTPTSMPASSSSSSTSVFPISGNLKSSLGAMAASFSASSSISSINRSSSSNTPPTTSSSTSLSALGQTQTQTSTQDYFCVKDYLPTELCTAWAVSALQACHRENRGMSALDAEVHYIQHASMVHECVNSHIFRMRSTKSENGLGSSWFVIYSKGIKIFSSSENPQQQTTFLWPSITKLSFERKKFEIRSGDCKILLYATSDEKNKMLLTLCRETHQFNMKIAARLKEVIKREEEESNCIHACYIYSRSLHLPYKNKSDQRISVISSTSSNTTSGIVSDRVHSEDEVEIMINTPPAPIAAPSTESLALAHLLDRPSVSRQTSSVGQVSLKDLEEQLAALSVRQERQKQHSNSVNSGDESPVERSHTSAGNSSSSSSNQASQRAADSSTATDSPSSQHNIGSQCSSTCSTVVVLPSSDSTSNTLTSLAVHSVMNSTPIQRRNSTSSSLELGFSHTAQNSILSEAESTCIDHDFASSTRDENESISGVYTLAHGAPPTETSGVYTMHSSEMTGQSSEIAESEKSSHYGVFQPTKCEINADNLHESHSNLDSVDGGNYLGKRIKNEEFRLRSDSNVSTSGSFRGDGSDPTDNKHNLLSAEELTDLIVGRGTYPNRKTVSSTLDSDCDYVTLPLPIKGESYIQGHQDTAPTEDQVEDLINDLISTDPPAPPQRIDSNILKQTKNLTSLSNIPMRSPPPYHARHEKTGLCGPPVCPPLALKPIKSVASNAIDTAFSKVPSPTIPVEVTTQAAGTPTPRAPTASSVVRRRDPPPYPTSTKPRPMSLVSIASGTSSLTHSNNALSSPGGSLCSLKAEEVTARFITTRPQINILKAHTSVINDNQKPSYAAPTHCSSAASTSGSIASQNVTSHLSQHSVHNSHYISGSQVSLNGDHHSASATRQSSISAAAIAHAAAAAAAGASIIPNTIGIPIVPYSLHGTHSSMSSLHQQPPPPPPPYPEIKQSTRTCVLLPVIKHRQFLPPPPPSLPRQPPPPPPPSHLGSVYRNQLARKQLEVYQQQLYSDVDYVIYPIQDPAVSQQEYLDAKQSSIYAAMAQTPPQPLPHAHPPPHSYLAYHTGSAHVGSWDTCKGHAIYRSTPYLPLTLSTHSRYASTQNLSDTYVQLPSTYSPLYSPSMASLCSSYEPPPPPPLHPAALAASNTSTTNLFARSRSDDNILNSLDSLPKVKRMPPPPPPPYVNRRLKKPPMPTPSEKPPPIPSKPTTSNILPSKNHVTVRSQLPPRKPPTLNTNRSVNNMTRTSSGAQWAGERPKPNLISYNGESILAHLQASVAAANRQTASLASTTKSKESNGGNSNSSHGSNPSTNNAAVNPLDITVLREKSKHLDLPLISALCNDHSLLKQTKVFNNSKGNRTATSASTTMRNASMLPASPSSMRMSSAINHTNNSKAVHQSLTTNSGVFVGNESGNSVSAASPITAAASASVSSSTSALATTTTPAVSSAMSASTTNTKSATSASSTIQLSSSKGRRTASSHRHPNDKLPPLPMQMAEANNYVMDPAIMKHHKSYTPQI